MTTPTPLDLFIIVWSKKMHEEKAVLPGSPEWNNRRVEMKQNYSEVWQDCVELSKHLAKHMEFCNDHPESISTLVERTDETRHIPEIPVHTTPVVPEACIS